ncbi:MAG: sulfotransferase family 2 domain-containing protein [Candidatus Lokiarchaeota archaeon]|nr:sulfotransferase family 2 domain-containing protein [Candidatus Lokiarchaeota archaeon]
MGTWNSRRFRYIFKEQRVDVIHEGQKIIFIGNPRACTTSLSKLLKPKGFNFKFWHDPVQYYIDNIKNYQNYEYFMICRNPYDRFLSWWFQLRRHSHDFIMKYKSFEEWIKSGEYHDFPKRKRGDPRPPRTYWQTHCPLKQFDFIKNDKDIHVNILKFEKIQEDWINVFCKKTKVFNTSNYPKLPITNETNHKKYEDYYTEELKEIVYNHAKEDFLNFGYER